MPLIGNEMNPFADAVYKRLSDRMESSVTNNNNSNSTLSTVNQDQSKHYHFNIETVKANNPTEFLDNLDYFINAGRT